MTRLKQLLTHIKKEHVYIQMHNYPDQDAIASAVGLQELLKKNNIASTICYKGQIDKFNTLKMIEMLNINIKNIFELNINSDDEIIIVDAQKGNINVEDFKGEEIACIDHHKIQDTEFYRFYDIREELGSCATIIAEYFLENNIEISRNIATALVYGIKVDTANLSRGVTNKDLDMFCMLYKKSDASLLRKFDNCSLKLEDLQAYVKAIYDLRLYGNIGIANIGNNCSEAIVGTLSDFLIELSEIDITVVHSYRAGGIKVSVRSEIPEVDASELVKYMLKGLGGGGGHTEMAAGFIADINDGEDAEATARLVEQRAVELASYIQNERA